MLNIKTGLFKSYMPERENSLSITTYALCWDDDDLWIGTYRRTQYFAY